MVLEELVFGSSDQFEVLTVQQTDDQVVLSVQSRSKGCHYIATTSANQKTYRLLVIMFLHLRAKKWHCLNTQCSRKIFAERFPYFFMPYKRTTDRLREKLLNIALLMGGRPGEKLCRTYFSEQFQSDQDYSPAICAYLFLCGCCWYR